MTEVGGQGPFGWALGVGVVLLVLVVGLLGRAFGQRRLHRRPAEPADRTSGANEPNEAPPPGVPPAAGPPPVVGEASTAAATPPAAVTGGAHAPPSGEPTEAGPARAGPEEAGDARAEGDRAPDGTESDSALASLDSGRFLTDLPEAEARRPVVMPTPRAAADDVRRSGDAEPPGEPRPPEQPPPR